MTDKAAPNIIDFFSGRPLSEIKQEKIIRISPEYDGLSMLYSNENNPDRYFAMRILFWGLRLNGDVVGFVPWLDSVVACPDIIDPLNGQFEGYYDPVIDNIFYEAPIHKVVELETSHVYFESHFDEPETGEVKELQENILVQELPDTIGTHALLIGEDRKTLTLTEVVSWRLYRNGQIAGTLVDPDKVGHTPILPGDLSLYNAVENTSFRFYFQHHIANQIKDDNPEALEAIAMLLDESAKKNNEVSILDEVDEQERVDEHGSSNSEDLSGTAKNSKAEKDIDKEQPED